MEDIICTVPEPCGDRDCKWQYHLAHYWIYSDPSGYTVCDSDGNHTDCEESDVPNWERQQQLWLDYYEYVARTGHDPVNEFRTPLQKPRKQMWQAKIRNWVGSSNHGLRVMGVRKRGLREWVSLQDVPVEVSDFLFLGHPGYKIGVKDWAGCHSSLGPDFKTFDELKKNATNCRVTISKNLGAVGATVSFEVLLAPPARFKEKDKAWLRRAAKKAIRDRIAVGDSK